MTGTRRVAGRKSRSIGRKLLIGAGGIVMCLLVLLFSWRKEGFGLLVMAGYGVLDRWSMPGDPVPFCGDGRGESNNSRLGKSDTARGVVADPCLGRDPEGLDTGVGIPEPDCTHSGTPKPTQ